MVKDSNELLKPLIEALIDISQTEAEILDLLSRHLPTLDENERRELQNRRGDDNSPRWRGKNQFLLGNKSRVKNYAIP
jgi:hypothetical protein